MTAPTITRKGSVTHAWAYHNGVRFEVQASPLLDGTAAGTSEPENYRVISIIAPHFFRGTLIHDLSPIFPRYLAEKLGLGMYGDDTLRPLASVIAAACGIEAAA